MMSQDSDDLNRARWLGDAPGHPRREPLMAALDDLYGAGPPPAAVAGARKAVQDALASAPPSELYFDILPDTPLGPVYLALSERGVLALGFGTSERAFLDEVRRWTGAAVLRAPGRAEEAARQVREYLAGDRTAFDLPLDLSPLTSFQRQVLRMVTRVPRGQVATYAEVARRIGRPRAARAVGQALRRNPIPLIIPCHRVLASDGSLGGYSGGEGLATKRRLLRLEGVLLDPGGGAQ